MNIELVFKELKKKKKRSKGDKPLDLISFSPSKEQILNKLKEPIKWLRDFINSINKLEADIVKVLGIPSLNIFEITEEYKDILEGY